MFQITPAGVYRQIRYFIGAGTPSGPVDSLVPYKNKLLGTTFQGGAAGFGSLFEMTHRGAFTILHSFGTGLDGADPVGNVIDAGGLFYGTPSPAGQRVRRGIFNDTGRP